MCVTIDGVGLVNGFIVHLYTRLGTVALSLIYTLYKTLPQTLSLLSLLSLVVS
jgi:hypothetical protein